MEYASADKTTWANFRVKTGSSNADSIGTSKTWLHWLLLLLLPVLLHLPGLTGWLNPDPMAFVAGVGDVGHRHAGTPWIDPNTGFQAQALGKLSADLWLAGDVPWWNPYNGVGLPLAAEAQPGSFFLPFVLLYHFRSGGIWVELILQIIAGVCTLAFLRRLGLTALAAFTGAVLFELNGTFAWHGAPIASPVAFLPMLLLGVEMLRTRVIERGSGGWWVIPPALAWSIYAGFPEVAYIDGLFVGAWSLFRFGGLTGAERTRFFGTLSVAVLVGLLLSLPLLVPFAEYVGHAYIGFHESVFSHLSPPYATLPLYLSPWLYGPIFSFNDPAGIVHATWGGVGGYFTAAQVLLAALAVVFCRRGLCFLLLGWIALCLAKSFDLRPVSDAVNLLPMIKSAAFFRYAPASWEFAGVVLVALTIDGMQRRASVAAGLVAAVACITALAVAATLLPQLDTLRALLLIHGYAHYFLIALGWLIVSCGLTVALVVLRQRWPAAIRLLALLVIVDASLAFALPIRSGVKRLTRQENGVAYLQSHLDLQRTYTLGPLSPNYGAFFQIAQINHNYLPVSQDWVNHVHDDLDSAADPIIFNGNFGHADAVAQLNAHIAAYESLGVKYVLAPPGTNPFAQSKKRPTEAEPATLGADRPIGSNAESNTIAPSNMDGHASAPFDAIKLAYSGADMAIYQLPHPASYFEMPAGDCAVHGVSRQLVEVACIRPSHLLRREAFYPGWRARIDGTEAFVKRSDSIFQSVDVPRGRHTILFSYLPSHAWLILGAFAVGSGLWLMGAGLELRRRRSA